MLTTEFYSITQIERTTIIFLQLYGIMLLDSEKKYV